MPKVHITATSGISVPGREGYHCYTLRLVQLGNLSVLAKAQLLHTLHYTGTMCIHWSHKQLNWGVKGFKTKPLE